MMQMIKLFKNSLELDQILVLISGLRLHLSHQNVTTEFYAEEYLH